MGNTKKVIKRTRCIVYRRSHVHLVSNPSHPAPAVLIVVGGPSVMCYHTQLIIKRLRCILEAVWDWYALAKASLGIEVTNLPLHFFPKQSLQKSYQGAKASSSPCSHLRNVLPQTKFACSFVRLCKWEGLFLPPFTKNFRYSEISWTNWRAFH